MPLDDSYIRLAHAIVVQAAKDSDTELDWFRQNPPLCEEDRQHQTYLNHKSELQSLERFFRSGWFELLPVWTARHSWKKYGKEESPDDCKAISLPSLPAERAHQF